MAGDWIKMRTNLWDDPRVSMVCDLTGQGEAAVIGAMYWLWATADQHSDDGTLHGLTLKAIDRKTGIAGFGEAMKKIGWLDEDSGSVVIIRFEEHNGESAKKRAQTAKRVAIHKAKKNVVTHEALPERYQSVSQALPREEKRREDVNRLSDQPALTTSTVSAREEPQPRALDDPPADSQSPPSITPTAAALLARAMRDAGIAAQPADPRLIALADRGVSAETVAAAAAEAKAAKPDERIPVGYVVGIIERWAKDAAGIAASCATSPPARASPRFGNDARSEDRKRAYEALTGRKAPRIEDTNHARIIDITPSAASAFPALAMG